MLKEEEKEGNWNKMSSTERELRKLEQKLFLLEMQDHWDSNDYKYANELHDKIMELEGKLKQNDWF